MRLVNKQIHAAPSLRLGASCSALVLAVLVGCASPDPTVLDFDGDGVADMFDAFPVDPAEQRDTDGDGVGDNADAFPTDPDETADTDEDGVGDNTDSDDDNDGLLDGNDPDPLDPNNPTPVLQE